MLSNDRPLTKSRKPSTKRTRDAIATRAAILAAATEEFAEKGFSGARVEEIAALTDTSKHMIYYHFRSKELLYRASLERAYKEFGVAENAENYDALSPADALKALIVNTFNVHISHPHIVRIIMAENINRGMHLRTIDKFERRELALDTLRNILVRGEQNGTFLSCLDPLQIHLSISALCFHYIANVYTYGHVFNLDAHGPKELATRRDEIVRTILARCLAPDR